MTLLGILIFIILYLGGIALSLFLMGLTVYLAVRAAMRRHRHESRIEQSAVQGAYWLKADSRASAYAAAMKR